MSQPQRPRAVAYIRVSTMEQVDGYGLDVQQQQVRECSKRVGFRLVATTRDEGVSGGLEVEERPGLAEALAMLEAGEANVLVVARLDRLARKLTIQEAALAHAWRHGARVWSCDIGEVLQDDPDDPMRTAMRQMAGVFAQLERGMIRARMREGRRRKAERGGYAFGSPAFGYHSQNGVLVPDEREQAALTRMVELQAEGLSLRQIADRLHEEGHRSKRGGRWHPQTVARVLERAMQGP